MKSLKHLIEDCRIDGSVIIITSQDWNDFSEQHLQSMKEHKRSYFFLSKYNSLNENQKIQSMSHALRHLCQAIHGKHALTTNRVLIQNTNNDSCISFSICHTNPFL
jgi:ABC-type glutathione transport system ATPase component